MVGRARTLPPREHLKDRGFALANAPRPMRIVLEWLGGCIRGSAKDLPLYVQAILWCCTFVLALPTFVYLSDDCRVNTLLYFRITYDFLRRGWSFSQYTLSTARALVCN